jgi:hypothetical protein
MYIKVCQIWKFDTLIWHSFVSITAVNPIKLFTSTKNYGKSIVSDRGYPDYRLGNRVFWLSGWWNNTYPAGDSHHCCFAKGDSEGLIHFNRLKSGLF